MEKSLCIVLRTADYRDNDKMLTLFSREQGKLNALSRGCKKATSALLACSEVFTCGMYSYYNRSGKYYISQCEISDTFYSLRQDVERFSAAAFIAEACEKVINHGEPNDRLFSLVANAFYALKNAAAALNVLIFFMVKYSDIEGYRPNIYCCAVCGKKTKKNGNTFSYKEGGIICASCAKNNRGTVPIGANAVYAIHEIGGMSAKAVAQFVKEEEVLLELLELFVAYIEEKLEKKLTSTGFLKRIFTGKQ